MKDRVSIDFKGGVADVRLIRADKMNALDRAMFDGIVKKYGSVDAFMKNELGIGPKQIAQLKSMYLN